MNSQMLMMNKYLNDTFEWHTFYDSHFNDTHFNDTYFSHTNFNDTYFNGITHFNDTHFNGITHFNDTHFNETYLNGVTHFFCSRTSKFVQNTSVCVEKYTGFGPIRRYPRPSQASRTEESQLPLIMVRSFDKGCNHIIDISLNSALRWTTKIKKHIQILPILSLVWLLTLKSKISFNLRCLILTLFGLSRQ